MLDLNMIPLPDLGDVLLGDATVDQLLAVALDEDLNGPGDITSASIIDPSRAATAEIATRQPGIVAGLAAVERLLAKAGIEGGIDIVVPDGSRCAEGDVIARLQFSLLHMLRLERTMLNLLGRLSGVATLTRRFVDALAGMDCVVCDTRKTTPGLRHLEKYAVRCGGGHLHRIGLHDAALFKDNHIAHIPLAELADRLTEAIQLVREAHDVRFVEVEVDSIEQLECVLTISPRLVDLILLDNMPPSVLRGAVAMRNAVSQRIKLEASGGIELENVVAFAETGVERVAVGAITHGAHWLDVGLDIKAGA